MIHIVDQVLSTTRANILRNQIQAPSDNHWDRYDNPFEQKWVMKKPYDVSLQESIDLLRLDVMKIADRVFPEYEIVCDENKHFEAVFTYVQGDYLSLHLDADIEPASRMSKAVTALLYLSSNGVVGGNLEFWRGTRQVPIWKIGEVNPLFNTLVLFSNHSTAWHGNPGLVTQGFRTVITFSFLNHARAYSRERAFFAPEPDEYWSPEVYELRDKRADAYSYSQVYRVGDQS